MDMFTASKRQVIVASNFKDLEGAIFILFGYVNVIP